MSDDRSKLLARRAREGVAPDAGFVDRDQVLTWADIVRIQGTIVSIPGKYLDVVDYGSPTA